MNTTPGVNKQIATPLTNLPTNGPVPMDIGNVNRKLTPQERERCMKEGLCLYCRKKGHLVGQCPDCPKKRIHAINANKSESQQEMNAQMETETETKTETEMETKMETKTETETKGEDGNGHDGNEIRWK